MARAVYMCDGVRMWGVFTVRKLRRGRFYLNSPRLGVRARGFFADVSSLAAALILAR
jgi:hypothetical protein